MSGGNTTIYGLATYVGTPATTFRFIAQQTATTDAVALTGAQLALSVYSTTVTLTNQTTATSITATGNVSFFASGPALFVTISVNGTSYKLPLYNP